VKGYKFLKELSKQLQVRIVDLTAMSVTKDPYYAGAPAQKRAAEWFAELFNRFEFPQGVHLRAIHYKLVSQEPPIRKPDGESGFSNYINTEKCWDYMQEASRNARHLRLVEAHRFTDARNPGALKEEAIYEERDADPDWNIEGSVADWKLPALQIAKVVMNLATLVMPKIETSGYDYSLMDQPVHIECWIEKSTMDYVLLPLCQKYGVNLVRGIGFQSITNIIMLLQRLANLPDDRPTRILYASDFDPSGEAMPVQVSRLIQYYIDDYAPERDIKLTPIALTREQVERYHLPWTPLKEGDKGAVRFQDRHGVGGATELDALEAIHPGVLATLFEEAIVPYRDQTLKRRLTVAAHEAEEGAEAQFNEKLGELIEEANALESHTSAIMEEFGPRLEELNERFKLEQEALSDDMQEKLGPIGDQMETLKETIASTVDEMEIEMPVRPTAEIKLPDESEWLYDSNRDYKDQLAAYKKHQGKPTIADLAKTCIACAKQFHAKRKDVTTCSKKCYVAMWRQSREK
jgi:hypothetical protein